MLVAAIINFGSFHNTNARCNPSFDHRNNPYKEGLSSRAVLKGSKRGNVVRLLFLVVHSRSNADLTAAGTLYLHPTASKARWYRSDCALLRFWLLLRLA